MCDGSDGNYGNYGRIGRDERAKSKDERLGNLRSLGSLENVAIKREQRLLADYAEREQQKDCEAGLI